MVSLCEDAQSVFVHAAVSDIKVFRIDWQRCTIAACAFLGAGSLGELNILLVYFLGLDLLCIRDVYFDFAAAWVFECLQPWMIAFLWSCYLAGFSFRAIDYALMDANMARWSSMPPIVFHKDWCFLTHPACLLKDPGRLGMFDYLLACILYFFFLYHNYRSVPALSRLGLYPALTSDGFFTLADLTIIDMPTPWFYLKGLLEVTILCHIRHTHQPA